MRQNKFSSQIIALKNCQMAEHWGLVVMLTCYMNNSLGQNYGCESVFKLRICIGEKCRNMNSFLFVMTYFKPKASIIIFSKNQPMLEINQPSTSNKAMTERNPTDLISWGVNGTQKTPLQLLLPATFSGFKKMQCKNNCMTSRKGPRYLRSDRCCPEHLGIERILLGTELSNFSDPGNRKSNVVFWLCSGVI